MNLEGLDALHEGELCVARDELLLKRQSLIGRADVKPRACRAIPGDGCNDAPVPKRRGLNWRLKHGRS